MQAHAEKDGRDLYVRQKNNHRIRHKDGGWMMKSLHELTADLLSDKDARRANLEFFTGLRNIVEHRYEKDIASLVAGRTQAYVLNFERTLVEWFGEDEGLGAELRFPIFVSSVTGDAVAAVKEVRKRVPNGVLEWLQDFDAGLEASLAADEAFDFRLILIPHTGPKSEADAAMTFVNLKDLDADQRAKVDQVQTIIRDKHVPVANLNRHKPKEVAVAVAAELGKTFNLHTHTRAWKYYEVRPTGDSSHPEETKSQFCIWDETFEQYVYTDAWVAYLIRHLSDPEEYALVCGGPACA
jgi:hypothetical protein